MLLKFLKHLLRLEGCGGEIRKKYPPMTKINMQFNLANKIRSARNFQSEGSNKTRNLNTY